MTDPRFPRSHLTARNRRYPDGGWLGPAMILALVFWGTVACVIIAEVAG